MEATILVRRRETVTHIVERYESADGCSAMTVFTEKDESPLPAREFSEFPRLLPGAAYVAAAERAGVCEDYIDGMAVRFDGQW